GGTLRRVLGDGLLEQLRHFLLAFAERRTAEGVRINLQKPGLRGCEGGRHFIGKATGQRRLTRPRRAREDDQAVNRHDLEGKPLPKLQGQEGLGDKPVADSVRDLDRPPRRGELRPRQGTLVAYRLHLPPPPAVVEGVMPHIPQVALTST